MARVAPRRIAFPAMGTTITLLVGQDEPVDAVAAVRDLFADWERTLSRFRPDSELSRLNASAGRPVEVSPLLMAVTRTALAAATATSGAFDPLLGNQLVSLGYGPTVPERGGLAARRIAAAWRHVTCDAANSTVTIPAGAALDLGGVAKGMAVDAAVARLKTAGVRIGLISAGGDLRTATDGTANWQVGFDDAPGESITLHSGAVATSSRSRRTWLHRGRPAHHLLDPVSGRSAVSGLRAVSVAATTCVEADVAAKAAFVLGAVKGRALLERRDLAGLFVHDTGALSRCAGWPVPQPDGIAA